MKKVNKLFYFSLFCLMANAYAQPPFSVSHNVTVLQNATAKQCANYHGQVGPESMTTFSGAGEMSNISGPGVNSCTGCQIVGRNNDCVCRSCYNNYAY